MNTEKERNRLELELQSLEIAQDTRGLNDHEIKKMISISREIMALNFFVEDENDCKVSEVR